MDKRARLFVAIILAIGVVVCGVWLMLRLANIRMRVEYLTSHFQDAITSSEVAENSELSPNARLIKFN